MERYQPAPDFTIGYPRGGLQYLLASAGNFFWSRPLALLCHRTVTNFDRSLGSLESRADLPRIFQFRSLGLSCIRPQSLRSATADFNNSGKPEFAVDISVGVGLDGVIQIGWPGPSFALIHHRPQPPLPPLILQYERVLWSPDSCCATKRMQLIILFMAKVAGTRYLPSVSGSDNSSTLYSLSDCIPAALLHPGAESPLASHTHYPPLRSTPHAFRYNAT